MKKKRLVGIVMLFLTLVLVSACGPKSDLDPKKPVTLTPVSYTHLDVYKRQPWAFFAPHWGQVASASDAPQLLQNFPVPAGLPQVGQTTVLLSSRPFQTVVVSAASSMLRRMASARALATATSCRGAQLVQSISSSL